LQDEEELYYMEMQERVALGRAGRRAFGNRMFGSGGVVQGGRMKARPVPVTPKWSATKAAAGQDESPGQLVGGKGGIDGVASAGCSSADAVRGISPSGGPKLSKKAEAKAAKVAQKELMKERRREMAGAAPTPRKDSSA
jgi:hypothetical protein